MFICMGICIYTYKYISVAILAQDLGLATWVSWTAGSIGSQVVRG